MGLHQRASAAKRAFDALKALGRDLTSLTFETMTRPGDGVLVGRRVALFGANNYLGLTYDSEIVESGARAMRAHGAGATGSRIANGAYADHAVLKRDIAGFYDKRAAVVFSTGCCANLGLLSAIADAGDHLLIDGDSHASICDVCRLSAAETVRFRRNDLRCDQRGERAHLSPSCPSVWSARRVAASKRASKSASAARGSR